MSVLKKYAPIFVGLILVLFFIVSIDVSRQESTTMDEKAHIPASHSYVTQFDMRINPEHPPLLKNLAGLAIIFGVDPNPTFPITDPLWESGDQLDAEKFPEGPARTWGLAQWAFGDKLLHENGHNADAITFWARLPIIFIALILGFFIYIWTKELAGTVAGLFALVLYAFDPNIIGHSHYVTTDIGIAATVFISTYFFVRFLKQPSGKNILLSGIFLGVAQLTKFSAVLLWPLFGLMAVIFALAQKQAENDNASPWLFTFKKVWEYLWKYALSVLVCFMLIWIVYAINVWNMPASVIQEIARAQFPNDRPAGQLAETLIVNMSAIPFLKPLGEYFLGVFMVFARVAGGNTYYFLGHVTKYASQSYFPLVFVLKETLPFLSLLIISLAYTLARIGTKLTVREKSLKETVAQSIRERIAQYTMFGFILLYAYLSITGNLNIGFRHLFPILPFLYVLVAKTVFDFLNRWRENAVTGHVASIVLGGIALWIMAIPILAYPSYLSYFNPIGGGHENGYKYVTDSNYDWGQDLKRLKVWVDEYNANCQFISKLKGSCTDITHGEPIEKIHIDYFGGSNPRYYFGDSYLPWHDKATPEPGWYAISVGFYQESTHRDKEPGEASYAWLQNYPLVGRAGDSIFIFYISPESLGRNSEEYEEYENNEAAAFPENPETPSVIPTKECAIGGCNGELCTKSGQEDSTSVCVYKPEFDCYKKAACEPQQDGRCGWTITSEVQSCIRNTRQTEQKTFQPSSDQMLQ